MLFKLGPFFIHSFDTRIFYQNAFDYRKLHSWSLHCIQWRWLRFLCCILKDLVVFIHEFKPNNVLYDSYLKLISFFIALFEAEFSNKTKIRQFGALIENGFPLFLSIVVQMKILFDCLYIFLNNLFAYFCYVFWNYSISSRSFSDVFF